MAHKQIECPFCGRKSVSREDIDNGTIWKCWDCDSLFENKDVDLPEEYDEEDL